MSMFTTIKIFYTFILFTVIPVIKEKPKIIKIVKKKTVIVECKVLSKFAPACTWFKEASAVKEDSRHTVLIEPVREVSNNQKNTIEVIFFCIICYH